jgi:acyl carrier protein
MDIDFEVLGMDSLEAHMMASLLEDEYGISFEPMLLVDHKTLNSLAKYCTDVS